MKRVNEKISENTITELDILPDEILQLIFSFVDLRTLLELSLVCRRFKLVAEDKILYISHGYPSREDLKLDTILRLNANCPFFKNAYEIAKEIKRNIRFSFHLLAINDNLDDHLWSYSCSNSINRSLSNYNAKFFSALYIPNSRDNLERKFSDCKLFCYDQKFIVNLFLLFPENRFKLKLYLRYIIDEYTKTKSIIAIASTNIRNLGLIPSNIIILNVKDLANFLSGENKISFCSDYDQSRRYFLRIMIKKIIQLKVFNIVYLILNTDGSSFNLRFYENNNFRPLEKTDYIHPSLRKITSASTYKKVIKQLQFIKEDETCMHYIRFFHMNNEKCKVYMSAKIPANETAHEHSIDDMISFVNDERQRKSALRKCSIM